MVGPVSPVRGGIAYYTTELCRLLGSKHEVVAYSLERVYSSWLYLMAFGGSNYFDNSRQIVDIGVQKKRTISANPLTWLKCALLIRKWKADVVLVTWVDPFMFPLVWAVQWFLPKKARFVFICHNVLPPDKRPFARFLTLSCFKRADGFITHASSETARLLQLKPDSRYVQAYLPAYTLKSEGIDVKKQLKLRRNTLLFFGFVRQYKGVRHLLRALPLVLKKVDLDLLIVGEFWEDKREYEQLIARLGLQDHVKMIDRYVPNEDIGRYFAAADVVVLPYESGTQSAVVQVAYAHDTPVISTKVGGLSDAVFDGKTGFLVPPKDERALADAIIKFYRGKRRPVLVKNVRRMKQKFSWAEYVRLLESLF